MGGKIEKLIEERKFIQEIMQKLPDGNNKKHCSDILSKNTYDLIGLGVNTFEIDRASCGKIDNNSFWISDIHSTKKDRVVFERRNIEERNRRMLPSHPNQLSGKVKILNIATGAIPPLWGWHQTGSWLTAFWIFLIGFIAGTFIFQRYLRSQLPNHKRKPDGSFSSEDIEIASKRAMPTFLWAGPICGAIAAIILVKYM